MCIKNDFALVKNCFAQTEQSLCNIVIYGYCIEQNSGRQNFGELIVSDLIYGRKTSANLATCFE